MAHNNSDEAPKKFYISSNTDSHLSVCQIRCPLCASLRRLFHCRHCIRNGEFIHSTHHFSERFGEKQLKNLNLRATLGHLETKCLNYVQRKRTAEDLQTNVKTKRDKISLLRNLIAETQTRLASKTLKRNCIGDENRKVRIRLPKYEDQVKKLEEYVNQKNDENRQKQENVDELQRRLQIVIRINVQRLVKYIFPITQSTSRLANKQHLDTERALADATRTAYVQGQGWVLQASVSGGQHVIVAPTLPANGNYSAYNDWVASNKDILPNSANTESQMILNPAFRISAGLTFTSQLVQVLSYYLDVRLPFRIAYDDFCTSSMSEQQFTKKVARLNANILYLCYMQRMKLQLLQPAHTLHNITCLLNTDISELGQRGPIEPVDMVHLDALDTEFSQDLWTGEESEADGDDNAFPHEWETVPHLTPEHLDNQACVNSFSVTNNQQAASMAGGLMTSAAARLSFWRDWMTGK